MSIIITQNLVLSAQIGSSLPLNLTRIGYQTLTRGLTPTVSSTASGFFSGALTNSLTHEFWKPAASPATIVWDFGEAKEIDYIAFGAHELGSTGTIVEIESSDDGVTYTLINDFIAADDKSVMVLFDQISTRFVRVTLTYTTAPAIGVVYIGKSLVMQRGLYGGHSPATLSRNTEQRPITSHSGQFIGRSIVRRGFSSSASWKNLEAAWYRDNFDPFVVSALRFPFFFAWNPEEFPEEVAMCWSNSNISPTNMGIRDLMEVSIRLEGYGVDA